LLFETKTTGGRISVKTLSRGLLMVLGVAPAVAAAIWLDIIFVTLWPLWGLMITSWFSQDRWLRSLREGTAAWLFFGLAGPLTWVLMVLKVAGSPPAQNRREVATHRDPPPWAEHDFVDDPFQDIDLAAILGELRGREVTRTEPTELPPTVPEELPDYHSSPLATADAYVTMVVSRAEAAQRQRLEELRTEVAKQRQKVSSTAEKLRERQRTLGETQAALAEAERRLAEAPDATVEPQEQFERLMQLPGVIAVQCVNEGVRVIIRASVVYEGDRYDLGDWRIDLTPITTNILAEPLRSGVRPGWPSGTYPAYRLGGGVFCFGDRVEEINRHLAQRQYLEAIALAVECLNSVNDEHSHKIPSAFRLLGSDDAAPAAEETEEETAHAE
jgi:hypothetical protein